jgi:hypothetical protein
MSDDYQDPSGNTEAFRAFAGREEPPAQAGLPRYLIIGGAAAVAVVVILVLVLALG